MEATIIHTALQCIIICNVMQQECCKHLRTYYTSCRSWFNWACLFSYSKAVLHPSLHMQCVGQCLYIAIGKESASTMPTWLTLSTSHVPHAVWKGALGGLYTQTTQVCTALVCLCVCWSMDISTVLHH